MMWPSLVAMLVALGGPAEPAQRLELEPGEHSSFHIEGLQRVVVSGSAIELQRLEGEEFVVFGLQEGRAQLTVFRRGAPPQTWEVLVRPQRAAALLNACRELFGAKGCAGVEIVQAGGRLVLSARVRDLESYHRVRNILRAFPELYPLVEVEPAVLDTLAGVITAELHRAGFSETRLKRVGRRLFLEGTVTDGADLRKVRLIVEALYEEAMGGR